MSLELQTPVGKEKIQQIWSHEQIKGQVFRRSLFPWLRIVLICTTVWLEHRGHGEEGLVLQLQQSLCRPLFGDASSWAAPRMPSQFLSETLSEL